MLSWSSAGPQPLLGSSTTGLDGEASAAAAEITIASIPAARARQQTGTHRREQAPRATRLPCGEVVITGDASGEARLAV